MTENHRNYCSKCEEYKDHETSLYRNETSASDTYDFGLCHDCEHKLWGEFLPEEAEFPYDDGGDW